MKERIKSVRKGIRGFWSSIVIDCILAVLIVVGVLVTVYFLGVIDIRPSNYHHLVIGVVLIGLVLCGSLFANIFLVHKLDKCERENEFLKNTLMK